MTLPGKLIVFTAPSGSGKTTIVKHILAHFPSCCFSVSATTRDKRPHEVHGKDYYYVSVETFKSWISRGEFVEWEEVYKGQFYGTLKSEIERITAAGHNVVFDVDVQGAMDIKYLYPEETMTVFIKVPSLDVLEQRLRRRGVDNEESLKKRLDKAAYELTFEPRFDEVLINDDLEQTLVQAEHIVQNFLN